ncbi:highly derived D5-like helicase-primase [Rhizophagus irregularis DAOM 181602=DAOM 197198]|nr:highly derived D5-like helicase-primase [Rhizophagus irregularis DAOM 181602=DAOM 197198]
MTTQAQVIPKFGEQTKAFSINELKRLIVVAKSMSDFDQAKRYLCSYFIPCADPHGVFWWDPDSKSLKHVIDKNIGKLIRPITKVFYTQPEQGPSQKTEFNIYKWFMVENTDVCNATCDPHKQRIFRSLTGQLYLNIFPGFLHVLRPISTFESTIHLAVKFIFSHIQDIWCSGDWNLTEYIIKWLAGVSAGRKMYSILYLKSGQGWGKGIIADFIQRSVLGTQLVYKTSDPQTILGSFNGQLQGKVLLLLEEMPTEKSQWNNLYRSLKDKVTSDIMEIHEKYKTPTHYKNFMSTIVLTNENALRVENDDRRTVFLDVSPSRKGDLNYFKKLSDAMKYPGTSKAFYAYLRAIADAYPDFNGNPPPMTTSKQEHIISTLPPLFQFIKDTYLVMKNYMTDLPIQEFYRVYTSYCETHGITPLSKINASRILSNELSIKSKKMRIGKTTPQVYSISREDLYKKFLGKNWIHETDEIDIEGIDIETSKKPASDPKALEKFLANIYNPANNPQDVQEKPAEKKPEPAKEKPTEKKPEPAEEKPAEKKLEPAEEKPAPVIRKTPPPLPPKPDHLKERPLELRKEQPDPDEDTNESNTDKSIDNFSDCYLSDEEPDQEEPIPEPDNYDVLDDLLSDSDFTTVNPAPKQQPEYPAESSASVTKPDSELASEEQFIPEPDTEPEVDRDPEPKEGTRAHWAWQERHRWDRKPWVKNLKDQVFNDLYNTGKELWAKYQDASDEYDWEILAFEIEECPTTRIEDEYQYYLMEVVDRFKDWIEYNGYLPKIPSRKELADLIRIYKENRNAEIIPTPSGYETMRADKGKAREIPEERPKTDMEREWEAANGIIDDWDEEDTEGAINDILGAIARLGQTLQARFPDRKFQILLPYENWKPGGWTSGNQPASLFSLLDHYDEAQLPDDADPDYFKRFIIYARDSPLAARGCNGELNDCLYECLKNIYGTFSKMPKSIEKPEYIKKALGLNRDAPIPFQKTKNSKSSFISVEKNCKTGIYETLEEAYQRIHEERDVFLQTTKKFGLGIDLSYHNWSYKRTALWLFERLSVGIPANDPLDPIEAECTTQQVYTRVFNNRMQTFQSDGNKRGIYTFIDLQRAKKLGLNIQLIQNGKPNALIYDREARIPGTVIFGEYVHFLFKIKNQGGVAGRVAKRVLNTLWGALCQRKRNYKTLTTDQTDPFTFPEGHTLDSIIPVGFDQWRFQFTNPGNPFKGEYPRIAPFLLARGRKITSEAIQPYKDKVRRIHTDGFILEEQPDSPALFTCSENADTTLKTFKFETAGYCHVKNANKVIWT